MITNIKNILCILCFLFMLNHCTNTFTSGSGGASETIAIFIKGTTISGEAKINLKDEQSQNSDLIIYLFADYYTTYVANSTDNFVDTTTSDINGKFEFSSLKYGKYNLYAKNKITGKSVFVYSIVISSDSDYSITDQLNYPGSVSGNVYIRDSSSNQYINAVYYDVYILGSPFATKTDNKGEFLLYSIPPGNYKIQSLHVDNFLDTAWNSNDILLNSVSQANGNAVSVESDVVSEGENIYLKNLFSQ